MRPSRRGAARARTRTAPVEHPQATVTKSRGTFYDTPQTARCPASGTNTRHPRTFTTATDYVALALWTSMLVVLIVIACAAVNLVAS